MDNTVGKVLVFVPLMLYFIAWCGWFVYKIRTEDSSKEDQARSAFVNDLRQHHGTFADKAKVLVYRVGFYFQIVFEFMTLASLAFREGALFDNDDTTNALSYVGMHVENSTVYKLCLMFWVVVYGMYAYFGVKKWHKNPTKNPIFTEPGGKGAFATVLAEMCVIPAVSIAFETTECTSDNQLKADYEITCWTTFTHWLFVILGMALVGGIVPLGLYYSRHKNKMWTSGFYFLPIFNVLLMFSKVLLTGFISASDSAIGSSAVLIIIFAVLVAANVYWQPCMGASLAPNCCRTASFTLCCWSSMCSLWAAVICDGKESDDCDWQLAVYVWAGGLIPIGVGAFFANRPLARKANKDADLFGEDGAIKALTSSEMMDSDDRQAGLALIEAIKNNKHAKQFNKRGSNKLVMAMFKSAKSADLLAMLRVADVEVLTLGCEILGATVIDDLRRDELKEAASIKLFELLQWDWPALRLNSLRAVMNLSFEGYQEAPSSIDLSRTAADFRDILSCSSYTNLEEINLSGCTALGFKIGDALGSIPSLRSVNLERCNEINDKQMEAISQISHLTSLNIADCFKITDRGVRCLWKLKGLHKLDLTRSKALQSTIRTVLDSAKELRNVTLAGTTCTDAVAEELAQLKHLQKLDLSNTSMADAGIAKLPTLVLANLEKLNLNATQITDQTLALVAASGAQLVKLSLGETAVTDAGVRSLQSFRVSLTELDLHGCYRLTLDGGALSMLSALRKVVLHDTGVNDSGAIPLTQMGSLQVVHLAQTSITDDTIYAACKPGCKIAELNVAGCRRLTPEAMKKWDTVGMFRQVDSKDQKVFDDIQGGQGQEEGLSKQEQYGEEKPDEVSIGVGVPAMGSMAIEVDGDEATEGDGLLANKKDS